MIHQNSLPIHNIDSYPDPSQSSLSTSTLSSFYCSLSIWSLFQYDTNNSIVVNRINLYINISTNLLPRCRLFSPGVPVGPNGIANPSFGLLDVVALYHPIIKVIDRSLPFLPFIPSLFPSFTSMLPFIHSFIFFVSFTPSTLTRISPPLSPFSHYFPTHRQTYLFFVPFNIVFSVLTFYGVLRFQFWFHMLLSLLSEKAFEEVFLLVFIQNPVIYALSSL